jgi:hypothetical protein
MKTIIKTVVVSVGTGLLFILDVPPEFPLRVGFVPEAQAVLGVRRRTRRRTAVIVGSTAAASANASAAAQSQPAAAPAPAPAPAADGKPLPLGTVVPSLPSGCTSTPVGGVDYQYCGGNFYRAVFQGNTLVYVTAKP